MLNLLLASFCLFFVCLLLVVCVFFTRFCLFLFACLLFVFSLLVCLICCLPRCLLPPCPRHHLHLPPLEPSWAIIGPSWGPWDHHHLHPFPSPLTFPTNPQPRHHSNCLPSPTPVTTQTANPRPPPSLTKHSHWLPRIASDSAVCRNRAQITKGSNFQEAGAAVVRPVGVLNKI